MAGKAAPGHGQSSRARRRLARRHPLSRVGVRAGRDAGGDEEQGPRGADGGEVASVQRRGGDWRPCEVRGGGHTSGAPRERAEGEGRREKKRVAAPIPPNTEGRGSVLRVRGRGRSEYHLALKFIFNSKV